MNTSLRRGRKENEKEKVTESEELQLMTHHWRNFIPNHEKRDDFSYELSQVKGKFLNLRRAETCYMSLLLLYLLVRNVSQ